MDDLWIGGRKETMFLKCVYGMDRGKGEERGHVFGMCVWYGRRPVCRPRELTTERRWWWWW